VYYTEENICWIVAQFELELELELEYVACATTRVRHSAIPSASILRPCGSYFISVSRMLLVQPEKIST
jgi:hypothetical protein